MVLLQSGQAFDIIHAGFADIAAFKGDAAVLTSAEGTLTAAVVSVCCQVEFCFVIHVISHNAASSYLTVWPGRERGARHRTCLQIYHKAFMYKNK